MDRIKEKLSAVGDAIREKTGKSELLSLDEMPSEIAAIETGIKTDDATAVSGDILSGKTAYIKGNKVTGTIPSRAAATITPSTSNQTIAAGTYLSGAQTIAGDADLVAGNIKKGVNIFGVAGSYDPLYFTVVGGTTQPTNPTTNMIWINTNTEITDWMFVSASNPGWTPTTEGTVAIHSEISRSSNGDTVFDVIREAKKAIYIIPISAKQYIDGAWVAKTAKIYKNGKWVEWIRYLYKDGNECNNITGGIALKYGAGGDYGSPYGTATKNTGNIRLTMYRGSEVGHHAYSSLHTVNKVDLNNCDAISVNVTECAKAASDRWWLYVSTTVPAKPEAEIPDFASAYLPINNKGTYTLPINGFESAYVGVGGRTGEGVGSYALTITQLMCI